MNVKKWVSVILLVCILATMLVSAADNDEMVALGKNECFEFVNTTEGNITVRTDAYVYSSSAKSDYTVYKAGGELKRTANNSSDNTFELLPGEKLHMRNPNDVALNVWIPFAGAKQYKAETEILTLRANDSYAYINNTNGNITVRTDAYVYSSSAKSDYTVYKAGGELKRTANNSSDNTFELLPGEKLHMRNPNDVALNVWVPFAGAKQYKAETEILTLGTNDSYAYVNNTNGNITVRTNAYVYSSSAKCDYTLYKADGTLKKTANNSSDNTFELLPGEKIHLVNRGDKVLLIWIPFLTAPYSEIFKNDYPSSWARGDVARAIELQLVPESLQRDFTANITRAEFCALAVPLYERLNGEINTLVVFTDTDDLNVRKIGGIGVVQGVGNGAFNPDGEITRQEAALILFRLMAILGHPLDKVTPTFTDTADINSWARGEVGAIQARGIMVGSGNIFSPLAPYTREQSITTLLRVWDIVAV